MTIKNKVGSRWINLVTQAPWPQTTNSTILNISPFSVCTGLKERFNVIFFSLSSFSLFLAQSIRFRLVTLQNFTLKTTLKTYVPTEAVMKCQCLKSSQCAQLYPAPPYLTNTFTQLYVHLLLTFVDEKPRFDRDVCVRVDIINCRYSNMTHSKLQRLVFSNLHSQSLVKIDTSLLAQAWF